jgi:flavin reductase (DIM6/NTAB) family NADH-FMN oxidoreductase RutF
VDAPHVKEFPHVLECRLYRTVELGLHTMFVGEIEDVKSEESILGEDGMPDIEKLLPLIYVPGSQKYYGVGRFVADAFSVGKKVGKC